MVKRTFNYLFKPPPLSPRKQQRSEEDAPLAPAACGPPPPPGYLFRQPPLPPPPFPPSPDASAGDGGRVPMQEDECFDIHGFDQVPVFFQSEWKCSLCCEVKTYLGLGFNYGLGFGCGLGFRVQGLVVWG